MSDLRYHAKALEDFEQIWDYAAFNGGTAVADRLTAGIREILVRVVASHPNAGRSRPEFGRDIRSFPIVPYVVFYRVTEDGTFVLRVLHGHRDIHAPLMSLLAAI